MHVYQAATSYRLVHVAHASVCVCVPAHVQLSELRCKIVLKDKTDPADLLIAEDVKLWRIILR